MIRAALVHMTSVALLCLPMTGTVGAQTATPEQTAKSDKPVTIVGCLVQGNPPAPTANEYFVRTPTVAVPVGGTVTVGKPGTTDTTTSGGKPTRDSLYRITGLTAEQLRPHVGHRVEFQGHLSSRKPDAAAGGVTATKTTVDAAGKPRVTVETRVDVVGDLHATALKMVSDSCK